MKRPSMKQYVALAAVVVIAAGSLWGYQWYKAKQKPAVAGQVVTVESGDVRAVVSATGTIKAVNMVDVSSKITGLIKEVKVVENQQVKAGQVLMVLDDKHLRAQVAQAEAKLANATANYQRSQQLNRMGALADQQLDAARMDYQVAQASYDDAVSQLEDTIIRAPLDGQVIGEPIPAGQTVSPGISTPMVLMSIGNLSKMQIQAQVDESDIGKIAIGQPVTFTVDAYPGKTLQGQVIDVSKKATTQQNVVYYNVLITVQGNEELLKPSMTARVSIIIGEHKQVPVLPLAAVKDNKGQQTVQLWQNGQPEAVAVTTGLSNEEWIEISSGVSVGDKVLLPAVKTSTTTTRSGGFGGPPPIR